MSRRIVLAGRRSRLAVRQTRLIADALRRAHPGLEVSTIEVSTTGDRDARPFRDIGGKGLFVAEVERAVVEGRADAAVHSAKDLTARLGPGCTLVCIPAREDVRDVVVGGQGDSGQNRIGRLPTGARVGTSSMRRRALMARARPDVEVVEFRGNLDTRLGKVADGDVDAAVLAAAGIARLGADASAAPLDPQWWIPAPGQGALAVEALDGRAELAELFGVLDDASARAEVAAERAFAQRLEGGCSVPLGCLARAWPQGLVVTGWLGLPDGSAAVQDRISGPSSEAAALGTELAEAILQAGGGDLLADIRESDLEMPAEP